MKLQSGIKSFVAPAFAPNSRTLHRRGNGDGPLKLHKGRNGTFLMGRKDGTVINGHVINDCSTLDKNFDGKTHALPQCIGGVADFTKVYGIRAEWRKFGSMRCKVSSRDTQ